MNEQATNTIHYAVLALALIACDQRQLSLDADVDGSETSEAETEESETQDPSTESGVDTSTFIMTSDTEDAPVCDPFMQDCAPGEKCVPWASSGGTWDANKCVPVTGNGQVGDLCTSDGPVVATDDCGQDSICWDTMDVDGELIGVCTLLCGGTANDPICIPQTSCVVANEGAITLCIATCDPLLQDCADGLGCFWAVDNFNCVFTTDELASGEPCGYINDCAPGNLCTDAATLPSCAGSACCAPYCDLLAPDCAAAETECVTFFEEGLAPPGYEDVGICVLPA